MRKAQCQAKKMGSIATKDKVKDRKTVLSFKHEDFLGNGAKLNHHSVPSAAWQDNVNANMGKA